MFDQIRKGLTNECNVRSSNNGSVIVKKGYIEIQVHSEGQSYIATEMFRFFDNQRKKWSVQRLHVIAALEISTVLQELSKQFGFKLNKDGN